MRKGGEREKNVGKQTLLSLIFSSLLFPHIHTRTYSCTPFLLVTSKERWKTQTEGFLEGMDTNRTEEEKGTEGE